MCGFFGVFSNKNFKYDEIITYRKISKKIKHRGPDYTGEYISKKKNFFSVHHRLSIIDLKKNSNQPFKYKNLIILFNGEIYNYKHLKKILQKEFVFKTSGDTEVLLYSWIKWGKNFHKYIDGMYSFVIYDGKRIFLVSDNFSEKPLFYLKKDNKVFFSSEKSLLTEHLKLKSKIESNHINCFMALGYFPYEFSIHKNLKYLKPATIVQFDRNLKSSQYNYWKKKVGKPVKNTFNEFDKIKLKKLLINSVKNRLIADVPIAHFMSSGFDSTLIAAICKKELNYDLKTYTVKTPENHKEIQHVKQICRYLGISNKIVKFNYNKNFNKISKNLLNIYGEPNDNITTLMFMEMSKIIRKDGFKVSLCGLGGDELILGYNKYSFINKINKYTFNQNKILYLIIKYLKYLFPSKLKNNFERFILSNKFDQFLNFRNIENYKKINSKFSSKLQEINNDQNILDSMYNFDLNNTLPLSYIKALDLGSMNSSIEVRSPFLNKKVFKFLREFDNKIFFNGTNKKIYKDILLDYIPEELIPKSKIGFSYPLKNCINFVKLNKLSNILHKNIFFIKKNSKIKKNNKNFDKLIFRLFLLNNFLNEKN